MTCMEVMKHLDKQNTACKMGIVTCDCKWNSAVHQNCIGFSFKIL